MGENERGAMRGLAREALWVLVAGWVVRGVWLAVRDPGLVAMDARYWEVVLGVLREGGNPYVQTTYLNHPPFWMQCIYGMGWLSGVTGAGFQSVLWGVLIAAESAVVVALLALQRELGVERGRRLRVMFWGVALNPALVLQVTTHGNFDVFVGLCVTMFAARAVRFQRTGEALDWLGACAWLGMGILVKTVPLALVPVLMLGRRRLDGRALRLGALLTLGPVAVGISVIYVLAPQAVREHVLAYRSQAGWYGATGLMRLAGAGRGVLDAYGNAFSWVLLAWIVGGIAWLWRRERPLWAGRIALMTGATMLALPTLGPGFAPQYVWWYWPGLLAAYGLPGMPRWWRRVALVGAGVLVATYLVEYLAPQHRAGEVIDAGQAAREMGRLTLMRLPLFGAMLAVLGGSMWTLTRSRAFHETSVRTAAEGTGAQT